MSLPRTTASSTTGSPDGSSLADVRRTSAAAGLCAIHQPNFFPRLSTLAKLYTADCWVVLDNVQFTRRDYQHRARLRGCDPVTPDRWLSLATHLPAGRATLIADARLAEPLRDRRRTELLVAQLYRRSRHWSTLRQVVDAVLPQFRATDRLSTLAESSTLTLLIALGWEGTVLRSSHLEPRPDRCRRLIDLTLAAGTNRYLCGTGGMRYLQPQHLRQFTEAGIEVVPHQRLDHGLWTDSHRLSALHALAVHGPAAVGSALTDLRTRYVQSEKR